MQIGATFSYVSPDYGHPHIEGYTVYGTFDVSRHLGVEGVIRDATIISPRDIGEKNYLFGPRFSFRRGRLMPYAKVIGGIGNFGYQKGYYRTASSSNYLIIAYGGGVDYWFSRRLNLRAIDFEYQDWPHWYPHGLTPMALSIGAAYRF